MNLFKAISSTFGGKPEPEAEPVPDAPLNTGALLSPPPAVPPAPINLADGKPVFTEPSTPHLVAIRDEIVKTLKTCFDPEIPVNIYDLGLIYDVIVTPAPSAAIDVATAPAAAAADVATTSAADIAPSTDIAPASDTAHVVVRMTLTSPACPAAGSLPPEVQFKAGAVAGVTSSKVDLVWEPSWNPNLMSEAAKLQLGMF